MRKSMKIILSTATSLVLSSTLALAGEVTYDIRVDGMTCPFCVATSEKVLTGIDGVMSVSTDLDKGQITVCADDKVTFTDAQLEKMFLDRGFTYRSITSHEGCGAT